MTTHSLTCEMKAEAMLPRIAARTAGLALIVMAVTAIFTVGAVMSPLYVPGDAGQSFQNLQGSAGLFRAGLAGWWIILACDLLATWGLHRYFRPVSPGLSKLTANLRYLYTAILGFAVLGLMKIPAMLNNPGQADEVLQQLAQFHQVWSFGLVVFGLHLAGLGLLVLRSGIVPRIWGIFIMVSAPAYILIHGGALLIPNFEGAKALLEGIFMAPMILGETGLAVWLLWKGLNKAPQLR